jgi:hypothetical protein
MGNCYCQRNHVKWENAKLSNRSRRMKMNKMEDKKGERDGKEDKEGG